MKASDLQVRPIRHRREPRVRAHLLICMLACHVEMRMREALAPMLFDDERGPVRDSPVAKAERSPQARRKAASKRTSPGEDVHDFRGLLAQLGTPAMNRIEPSEPGKPGFDVPASPTPIQNQALRLLDAKVPMRQPPPSSPCPVDAQPESKKYAGHSKSCLKHPQGTSGWHSGYTVGPCSPLAGNSFNSGFPVEVAIALPAANAFPSRKGFRIVKRDRSIPPVFSNVGCGVVGHNCCVELLFGVGILFPIPAKTNDQSSAVNCNPVYEVESLA